MVSSLEVSECSKTSYSNCSLPSVLYLSTVFPPRAGSLIQRAYYNAKLLSAMGHKMFVVTELADRMWCTDNGHVLPSEDVDVRRVPQFPNIWSTLFAKLLKLCGVPGIFPDKYGAWITGAYAQAAALIEKHDVHTVLVNFGGPSALIVATRLKKRFPHLRVVVDVQDIWADNPVFTYGNIPIIPQLIRRLEERYFAVADFVVTIGKHQADVLMSRYPNLEGKVEVIQHGYDADLFDNARPSRRGSETKVIFRYTGALLPQQRPEFFFEALRKCMDFDDRQMRDVKVEFYGQNPTYVNQLAARYQVSEIVSGNGYVDHSEAVSLMLGADVLLLFWTSDPGCLCGKMFEYLKAKRLVLAFDQGNPEGRNLIESTQRGICVDSLDPNSQSEVILRLVQQCRDGKSLLASGIPSVSEFSRSNLAARLSKILVRVAEETLGK